MGDKEDKVYNNLRKHLDKHSLGYPATRSRVELKILKRLFSPEESKLAMYLTHKAYSVEKIFHEATELRISLEEMERKLDLMVKNGLAGIVEKEGKRYYYLAPFICGMYEWQINRLSPALIEEVNEYTNSNAFGLAFLGTKLPQMRTIPVRESIPINHQIASYNHMTSIINETNDPIVIAECICRKKAFIEGKTCEHTKRMETCMIFGDWAKNYILANRGREIGKEEALEIIRKDEAEGLILQPSNSQNVDFVCACCGCCCSMLNVHKQLPKPLDYWVTDYYAEVDADKCTCCGTCLSRCHVNAITIDENDGFSRINLEKCLGCGNCVTSCPSTAIHLVNKENALTPPTNTEELYDFIMANKQGMLDKIKLAAKIVFKR